MNNELAVKAPSGALATSEALSEWALPVVSQQDVILPKLLVMQGLSVAVAEGRAQMGEIRDSLSNNLVGSIAEPFECIPFYIDKTWDVLEEQADGTFKYSKTVPVVENPLDPDYNDNWKWEAEHNGMKIKNVRRFNFYVLLPKEIEEGNSIPYIFSFKSTSMKEGKKLFSQCYMRNIRAGLPPAAFTIKIGCTRQKNEKGIFIVPNWAIGRKSTEAELSECLSWIKMIRGGQVKVDDSDTTEIEKTVVADSNVGDY